MCGINRQNWVNNRKNEQLIESLQSPIKIHAFLNDVTFFIQTRQI